MLLAGEIPDLADALREVTEEGAAFVEAVLPAAVCLALRREADTGEFRPQQEEIGPVRQRVEAIDLRDHAAGSFPTCRRLQEELGGVVRQHVGAESALRQWRPNDVSIQRYPPGGDVGITPHLDGRRYGLLVAVLTIAGRARFTLCRDRAGAPIRSWLTTPGSLTLLRGPGLTGDDERPFHSVSPPLDAAHRYSIGFRMDTRRPVDAALPW